MSSARFEVYDTGDGWCFRLLGVDGAPVLSGEPVPDASACVDLVVRLKDLSESRVRYRGRDGNHGFTFDVVDDDERSLATGEVFGTPFEREMAMTTARLLAMAAPIIVHRTAAS